ncbi:MAG: phenylacetate--CoA ligase [Phycisphaerae bacterium]|nr:phenylacetate--CoA ligase [Phycisphaerae bacterium]
MSHARLHNPGCETLGRDELEQLQIERLQSTLNRVYRNVAFYRNAFDTHCVNLERIRDLPALAGLPFTTPEDLRKSYPYDMFAVPLRDIVRIHSGAAASGAPIVVGYTRNDLRNWTECSARVLAAAGITEHDVVQIALDYGLFPGGFGFQQGAEQIGASVIPASSTASVEKQIAVMKDFKTTALITMPSHALSIASGLEQMGLHPERLCLKLGLFGGERWSDQLQRQIEERLRIVATDTYGLTALMGPGVAGECHARQGMHINEDHFIVEVIDPKTLQPLGPGQKGELVLTTITKEGFPLIRYRTGDLTSIHHRPCACGRTFVRMARVSGRTDDLVVFRGVAFTPSQIEQVLAQVEGASPHYQIILDRVGGADTLEIKVEVCEAFPSLDEVRTLETLRRGISDRLMNVLNLDARVSFAEPQSLRREAGPSTPVVDRRGTP